MRVLLTATVVPLQHLAIVARWASLAANNFSSGVAVAALRTAAECAPTWEDPAAPSSDAQRRLQHILTCCQSLEEMNGEECFCDPDVANALGGPVALKDVGRVSKGACGFHMTFGESCR